MHACINTLSSLNGTSWKSPSFRRLCPLETGECEMLAAGQQLQGPVVLQKTLTVQPKLECSVVVAEEYIA